MTIMILKEIIKILLRDQLRKQGVACFMENGIHIGEEQVRVKAGRDPCIVPRDADREGMLGKTVGPPFPVEAHEIKEILDCLPLLFIRDTAI